MPDLRTVITDICARAGLDVNTDIDVSLVTGTFDGLAITDRTSARDTLQTLLSVFFIDAVESDDKIKFVPRGQSVVAAITEDDLIPMSSGDSGSGSGSSVLQLTRAQEADLPRQIDVTYISESNDWQSATQTARRMVTTSQQMETVSLDLALTDDAAATFADNLLWQKWIERETFTFQLPRDWLWLEAADVISLTVRGITRRLRLTKTESTTLSVKCTAVQDDPFDVTYTAVGSTPGGVTRVLKTRAATSGFLLNLPALSDSHDDAGFYALASYVPTAGNRWPGAVLYGSADGTAFAAMASLKGPAVYGICSTILGDAVCPWRWDHGNSLTVVLGQGELASTTADAVLNGANLALVGGEIIQFQTASLVATGTYTLSGLLRGRFGTEGATDGHGAGEVFLLLSAAHIVRVATGRSWLGLERWYRAVTSGQALADAATITFNCSGAALKPWAPCHLRGARTDAGDLIITWVRRARLDAPWLDGTDAVPLCEDSEAYDLEILDGSGTVKRTFTGLTNPTVPYIAAQQTADFGAVQSAVRVRVTQISAVVGRGTPKESTL